MTTSTHSRPRTRLARALRERRARRDFYRAVDLASPSMQQELLAAAAHQSSFHR